ncbi:transposase [Flavobacterium fryxellicola]|uniref:transposase n=1 Tax=Flavobacterium fryxellicola TaxID=249352 RepID=UPI003D15F588
MFGTIKRQRGYNHTNLTGLEKVNGEHSLIMLVYNIKRTMNILGIPDIIDKIQKWNYNYPPRGCAVIKAIFFKLLCEFKNIRHLFLSLKTDSLTSEFCANRKEVIELI